MRFAMKKNNVRFPNRGHESMPLANQVAVGHSCAVVAVVFRKDIKNVHAPSRDNRRFRLTLLPPMAAAKAIAIDRQLEKQFDIRLSLRAIRCNPENTPGPLNPLCWLEPNAKVESYL